MVLNQLRTSILSNYLFFGMESKIFCTFVAEELLNETIEQIKRMYTPVTKQMFVLYAPDEGNYALTYKLESGNIAQFPENTILVHRKREFRVLYTINALNRIIREENNGVVDKNYQVDWSKYRNCILLTRGVDFYKIATKLIRIESLN